VVNRIQNPQVVALDLKISWCWLPSRGINTRGTGRLFFVYVWNVSFRQIQELNDHTATSLVLDLTKHRRWKRGWSETFRMWSRARLEINSSSKCALARWPSSGGVRCSLRHRRKITSRRNATDIV
jgi:hypothetical protein